MKFPSRSELTKKIPNKFDAVIAISKRVKLLVDGKQRLIEENDQNFVKIAMNEIASGALLVEVDEQKE